MTMILIEFNLPDSKKKATVNAHAIAAIIDRGMMGDKPRTGIRLMQGCPKPIVVEHTYDEVVKKIKEYAIWVV